MNATTPAAPATAAPRPKPIKPVISETNKPFWDGCRDHKLWRSSARPARSGAIRSPTSARTACHPDLNGASCRARGELLSYIIIHRGYHPYWAVRVPYNVAFIQLDEGLRMFSNIVGTPNEKLAVGQRVKVAFEQRDEDLVVPVFTVVDKT